MPAGQPSGTYRVNIHGVEHGPFPIQHVRDLARRGELSSGDPVSYAGQAWIPASSAPGIFSDKTYVASILLSLFLGGFGVDRFYLGYTGLGVAKLLLNWMTLGIWALVDFILIVLRKVPDSQGRPLA
ncbi:TM2 domain-containing protein [Ornithinimicrobium sp. INDO-MA30-4]|uniref:TM2 domain-containing protein n=1 Tax=Ornithinimicrobium sp. INDO-MA30-4 TaxID=2908651 RepID=UPI001F44CEE0|nr:TM2 domain-containing protein [Ornithinimicrobium sp. INDO-MA30-4]UJH69754.1 TM2 domain-containing protein [Ornithinimicrobium sp. INDO-MA30-4]